jgi:hypothetical protein
MDRIYIHMRKKTHLENHLSYINNYNFKDSFWQR